MKKKKTILSSICATLCVTTVFSAMAVFSASADDTSGAAVPSSPQAAEQNKTYGWKNSGGKWSYTAEDGSVYKNGIYSIDGKKYIFSSSGVMLSGFNKSSGKIYYFSKSGTAPEKGLGSLCAYKGWKKISKSIYYFAKDNSVSSGLTKVKKNSFYFNKKGSLITGWKKIGKYKYFFKKGGKLGTKGKMYKNCIAGNKKDGYGYVSPAGRKITSKPIKLAVSFVLKHTSASASRSKKLKTSFLYIKNHFPYKRVYGLPNPQNLNEKYAEYMLKNKTGNCFCYAATISCIARVLGYDIRFNEGTITTSAGGPDVHGWAEIKIGSKWYLFDISMHNRLGVNLYKKLKNQYPHKYKYNHRYSLSFKNSKTIWKKA